MISKMDGILGYLLDKLEAAKLLDNMNIILLSDHGMTDIYNKSVFIYDYVDKKDIDTTKTVFNAVSNIYATSGKVHTI